MWASLRYYCCTAVLLPHWHSAAVPAAAVAAAGTRASPLCSTWAFSALALLLVLVLLLLHLQHSMFKDCRTGTQTRR
jgi:hypothetical protein